MFSINNGGEVWNRLAWQVKNLLEDKLLELPNLVGVTGGESNYRADSFTNSPLHTISSISPTWLGEATLAADIKPSASVSFLQEINTNRAFLSLPLSYLPLLVSSSLVIKASSEFQEPQIGKMEKKNVECDYAANTLNNAS